MVQDDYDSPLVTEGLENHCIISNFNTFEQF